jgi:hypothetical protein
VGGKKNPFSWKQKHLKIALNLGLVEEQIVTFSCSAKSSFIQNMADMFISLSFLFKAENPADVSSGRTYELCDLLYCYC